MPIHWLPYNFNKEKTMNLNEVVRLWYKTQRGHVNECRKNQIIFSDIMWKLYEKLEENKDLEFPEYQSIGDEVI